MARYEHTQPATVIVLALAGGIASCLIPARIAPGSRPILLLVAGTLLLCLWLFSSLTIEIEDRTLRWRFGSGWIQKEVQLAEIETAEIVRTGMLEGWGIHRTRRGWLYNVSGFQAVAIKLRNGRHFVLGTDEPEELLAALSDQLEAPRGRGRRAEEA